MADGFYPIPSHPIASHPIPSHPISSPPGIKYVAQDFGKNSCSHGTLVNTEAECRQAAPQLKKRSKLNSVFPAPTLAKGCIEASSSGDVYFNTHSTGGENVHYSPVCRLWEGMSHILLTQMLSMTHYHPISTSPHLRLCLVLLYSVRHYKPSRPFSHTCQARHIITPS